MRPFELPKNISLSTRISILLCLIILITMGAFSAFSLIKQEENSVDAITRNTLLLSQSVEKILRVSMLKNRRDEISMSLKDITGESGILSARILNGKGIVELSSRPSEVNSQIPATDKLCQDCHTTAGRISMSSQESFYSYYLDKENGIIYSSLPVYNAPSCYQSNCHASAIQDRGSENERPEVNPTTVSFHDSSQTILGFVEMQVSARKVMANLSRTREQLIILTVVMALLAFTIAYFSIRNLVGKPVNKLVEGTRRVAQGDFSSEISAGKGELKILAESFNHMQKQLMLTESQLIESERLASVGKIADQIANEINNPLTGIIVYTEKLAERSETGSGLSADYQTILRQAMRIRESVRNILSLARRETPRFEPVNVASTIRHAISVLEKLAGFRNIHIIPRLPANLPFVSADSVLLEQVMLDILLISSESMPSGGVLNISASNIRENNKIEIKMEDTGRGISPNALAILSDEKPGTNQLNTDKTGISLAVCKDIIALHKGKLRALLREGGGTTITIELPV